MKGKASACALVGVALLALAPAARGQALNVERYDSVAAFKARLARFPVKTVDFDAIGSSGSDSIPFPAGKYRMKQGMIITGEGGQRVGRSFGRPEDFVPPSQPNLYAPGPVDTTGTSGSAGGNETDVTFFAGAGGIRAAGFGCHFVDADRPQGGPSSIRLYLPGGGLLADSGAITTAHGGKAFVGFVAVSTATDQPVAAIDRVRIVNGSGWPGNGWNEGVALDNFMAGTAAYAVTGKVLTAAGLGVPGVEVTLAGGGFTRTDLTSGFGVYSFANIPRGTYTLVPGKPGSMFTPAGRTVTVGGKNVRVPRFSAD